jgi:hypothetical protein
MTDTIESLRARIAEVVRIAELERDEARAATRDAYGALTMLDTGAPGTLADRVNDLRAMWVQARADGARLAEALRGVTERAFANEEVPEEWRAWSHALRDAREALAAHDAGTPAGGVWLTAGEVGLLVEWGNAAPFDDEADKGLLDKLRKARGGTR